MVERVRRVQDWPTKLEQVINRYRDEPFVWGTFDCCLFVCDCILAMTGVDPAHEYRGKYTSEEDLAGLLAARGENGVPAIAEARCSEFGYEPIPVKMAGRGDLIMFDTELGPTLGILIDHRIIAASLTGLQTLRLDRFWNNPNTKAWRI